MKSKIYAIPQNIMTGSGSQVRFESELIRIYNEKKRGASYDLFLVVFAAHARFVLSSWKSTICALMNNCARVANWEAIQYLGRNVFVVKGNFYQMECSQRTSLLFRIIRFVGIKLPSRNVTNLLRSNQIRLFVVIEKEGNFFFFFQLTWDLRPKKAFDVTRNRHI